MGTTETTPRTASRLEGVRAYAPPPDDPRVDLRLDANERVVPPAMARRALKGLAPDLVRAYPNAGGLEARIASGFGIEPERVIVTNGGDEAIDRVCRAVLEPGKELVVHAPTFEMIPRSARLAGADVRTVPWAGDAFPVEQVVARIGPDTALVAVVSPNNPTGEAADTAALVRVARAAARAGVTAMFDLAYVEFADDDPTSALLEEPNVIVVRTFSKAMGLAGLRVGYAVGSASMIGWLRAAGAPYPVSGVSLALARIAMEEPDDGYTGRVREERPRLAAALAQMGFRVFESQANFVTGVSPKAVDLHGALLERGISVRSFASRPEMRDWLRITLPGDAAVFERLMTALRDVRTGGII